MITCLKPETALSQWQQNDGLIRKEQFLASVHSLELQWTMAYSRFCSSCMGLFQVLNSQLGDLRSSLRPHVQMLMWFRRSFPCLSFCIICVQQEINQVPEHLQVGASGIWQTYDPNFTFVIPTFPKTDLKVMCKIIIIK